MPDMIGGPGSAVFFSGDRHVFEAHEELLGLWGEATWFGPDAGLAALYDLAILAGMYVMFAGFLHGAAMVAPAGISAADFAARAAPFLAAMAGRSPGSRRSSTPATTRCPASRASSSPTWTT